MSGSIQCRLDRVGGTDLWALQLSMAQWTQVFLSAQLTAMEGPAPGYLAVGSWVTTSAERTFRGSGAPPAPPSVPALRGTVTTATVPSHFLDAPREVTVYLPPGPAAGPLPVLYMADGQNVPMFAPIVEGLIESGRIRPLALVGEHAGGYEGDPAKPYDPMKDRRAREYLPPADPPQFERHLRFFVEELLPWAERQYGLSSERRNRAAMGFSNGGAFMVRLGERHPEAFAAVMPFSPALQATTADSSVPDPAPFPRFLFAGGELERGMLENARAYAARLKGQGVSTELRVYWSGHDRLQWQQALADYLPEVFGAARP